ncbi:MAG: hypothetical protein ACYC0F_19140 [Rhodanobacter sp.]
MNFDTFQIQEQKPDHHYRTEIPNIIYELGLNPVQLTVYSHIKHIAGDSGYSWMSMAKLSKRCGVGETLLRDVLKQLTQNFKLINCPLIKVVQRTKQDGSRDTNAILIVDIWRQNGNFYRKKAKNPKPQKQDKKPDFTSRGVPRQTRGGTSPNEDKQEPSQQVKKTNKKSEQNFPKQKVVEHYDPNLFVCSLSSEDQKKFKILQGLRLSDKFCRESIRFSMDQIRSGIEAANQYASKGSVENFKGLLVKAISQGWKVNSAKIDKVRELEREKQELIREINENRNIALDLYKKYEHIMNFSNNFKVSDYVIWLDFGTGERQRLELADDNCIRFLEWFIETRILGK